MIGAAFTGLILSYLISLAAHINFRRRRTPEELAALPLRSPLGTWGSFLGFAMVTIAPVQTWLYPRINLWSGLTCLIALTLAYFALKNRAQKT